MFRRGKLIIILIYIYVNKCTHQHTPHTGTRTRDASGGTRTHSATAPVSAKKCVARVVLDCNHYSTVIAAANGTKVQIIVRSIVYIRVSVGPEGTAAYAGLRLTP